MVARRHRKDQVEAMKAKAGNSEFTISVLKARMVFFAGSYEREAIRPAVLGKFDDLLISTVRHPAMLIYLDNAVSIGPDSPAGKFFASLSISILLMKVPRVGRKVRAGQPNGRSD